MRTVEAIWNTGLKVTIHAAMMLLLICYNCMTVRGKRSVADSISRAISRREPVRRKRRR